MSIEITNIVCEQNRSAGESGIAELAENIRAIGLINPVTLQKTTGGKYNVIAGRRRFAALRHLGRTALDEGEYTVCEADAGFVAFCENHQRENLTIAEEVAELEELQKKSTPKKSAAELAAILGRTPQYVALRLNLCNLTPDFKNVLKEIGEGKSTWSIGALELLARETPETQNSFSAYYPQSADNIRRLLERSHAKLAAALFDVSCCEKCPKLATGDNELFADFADDPCCLDHECFADKNAAVIENKLNEFLADGAEDKYLIGDTYNLPERLKKYEGKILKEWFYNRGKGKANAFSVWGSGAGKCCHIKLNQCYKKEIEKAAVSEVEEKKPEKTLADREDELDAKRVKRSLELLYDYFEKDRKGVYAEISEAHPDTTEKLALMIQFALVFGLSTHWNAYSCNNMEKMLSGCLANAEAETLAGELFRHFSGAMASQIKADMIAALFKISDANARTICCALGVKFRRFAEQSEKEVPVPKSLEAARIAAKNKTKKGN